jgi:hypothetical protein
MPNLRTANYDEQARKRLGEAVGEARRAAGHAWRSTFYKEAKIGKRSVEAVEAGEPTVGVYALEQIGRALGRYFRDWDADTPRAILEGGPIPSHEPRRKATIDIRWVARQELIDLLRSTEDAIAYPRLLDEWRERFTDEGYDERDLLEISKQAAQEAGQQ